MPAAIRELVIILLIINSSVRVLSFLRNVNSIHFKVPSIRQGKIGSFPTSIEAISQLDNKLNTIEMKIVSPSLNSRRITASLSVSAPESIVWTLLTDYSNLPKYFPDLSRSQVLSRDEDSNVLKLYQESTQRIGALQFTAGVTLRLQEFHHKEISFELLDSLLFSDFCGSWQLEPSPEIVTPHTAAVVCKVKYDVLVRPKCNIIPVMAMDWKVKDMMRLNLNAVKEFSEQIYAGTLTPPE